MSAPDLLLIAERLRQLRGKVTDPAQLDVVLAALGELEIDDKSLDDLDPFDPNNDGPGMDGRFCKKLAQFLPTMLPDDHELIDHARNRLREIGDRLDIYQLPEPATERRAMEAIERRVRNLVADPENRDFDVIARYLLIVQLKRVGTMSAVGGGLSGLGSLVAPLFSKSDKVGK